MLDSIAIKNDPQSYMQCGFFNGGRRWIRTTEVTDNRFTVCPLWPLGNSPLFNKIAGEKWSWWTDSNPRPADYKSAALPAELHQRVSLTLEYYIIFEKICQGKSENILYFPFPFSSAIFPAFLPPGSLIFCGTSRGRRHKFQRHASGSQL